MTKVPQLSEARIATIVTHQVHHIIFVFDQSSDLPWPSLHDLVGEGIEAEVLIVERLSKHGLTRNVKNESIPFVAAFTISSTNEDLVLANTDSYRPSAWSELVIICDDQRFPVYTTGLSSSDSLCIQPFDVV